MAKAEIKTVGAITKKERAAKKPSARTKEHIREIIETEKLIKILQDNALHPRRAPLHSNRLAAIKCLLSKTLPDLKQIEQTTNIKGDLDLDINITFVD